MIEINVGDAREQKFPQAKLVFCDPNQLNGYGSFADCDKSITIFENFTERWIDNLLDCVGPAGIFIVSCHPRFTYIYQRILERNLSFQDEIIWHYDFGTYTRKRFVPSHLKFLVYSKEKQPRFNWQRIAIESQRIKSGDLRGDPRGRTPGTVWEFPRIPGNSGERMSAEIAQLPQELVRRFLKAYCGPGDLVIDPFCGSGTVPFMCQLEGLSCKAIDINDWCVKLSKIRCKLGTPEEILGINNPPPQTEPEEEQIDWEPSAY